MILDIISNKILFILDRCNHNNNIAFKLVDSLTLSAITFFSSTSKFILKRSSLSIYTSENKIKSFEYDSNLLNISKKSSLKPSSKSSLTSSPKIKKKVAISNPPRVIGFKDPEALDIYKISVLSFYHYTRNNNY